MAHEVEVGDIFVYTWGYDQTNVNFYQVVRTTEKTVTVREIETKSVTDEGFMSDTCIGFHGDFREGSELLRKTPQPEGYLKFDYGNAYPWNGEPVGRSWYA